MRVNGFEMNPLEPQDPLWKLLGQGRKVDARPNFTQNVLREARNTPQQRGWWNALKVWWMDSAALLPAGRLIALSALVVAAGLAWLPRVQVTPAAGGEPMLVAGQVEVLSVEPEVPVQAPLVPEVETQLESLDYLDELLALEDTSGLTDREIAYLLY
jgi:hypothetical protein